MRKKIAKKDLWDLIESYYLVNTLKYVYYSGMLNNSVIPTEGKGVHSLSCAMLNFIYQRTNLLKKDTDGNYTVSRCSDSYPALGFHIDKLLSAYANFDFNQKGKILVKDENLFAKSYQHIYPFTDFSFLLKLFEVEGVHRIIDLGCGMGRLMMQHCKASSRNYAYGIEHNCKLSSKGNLEFSKAGIKKRAKIITGDALFFDLLLSDNTITETDAIIAGNFLNEYAVNDGRILIEVLAKIKESFKGKTLFIMDYYSVFGTNKSNNKNCRHNYIHDVIQMFSGQGLTPPNYKTWNKYYKVADCKLRAVHEGFNNGVFWFVHVVKL